MRVAYRYFSIDSGAKFTLAQTNLSPQSLLKQIMFTAESHIRRGRNRPID